MNLPEKITQAETLQKNQRLHVQVGGHMFRNGEQFGYPAGYSTGPHVPERAKDQSAGLSTEVGLEDEK